MGQQLSPLNEDPDAAADDPDAAAEDSDDPLGWKVLLGKPTNDGDRTPGRSDSDWSGLSDSN